MMARRPTNAEARDLRADLETVRSEIESCRANAKRIERAPVSLNEVEARIDGRLDRAERVISDTNLLSSLVSPTGNQMNDLGLGFIDRQDPIATAVVWLGRSAVRARLLALAKDEYEGLGSSMTDHDREAATAANAARHDDLGRLEEALVRELERQGGPVARRADSDPRWFLAPDADLEGVSS